MNSNDAKRPRLLFWLSIGLFAVSLALPVDTWWGWQVFAIVFSVLPQVAQADPELVLLSLNGVSVNLLLFFSWVALRVSRLQKFAAWSAAGALILGVVCLLQLPMLGLGVGYWVWLAASAVALRASFRARTAKRAVAMKSPPAAAEPEAG